MDYKNKSRSGIQYGPKIKVGRYDWNKDTFEAALLKSGLPPDAPFNAKNQNILLDAHSKNVLYSDNQLTSIGAFTGDSDSQLSIEPVQVDFDESAIWNEEFRLSRTILKPNNDQWAYLVFIYYNHKNNMEEEDKLEREPDFFDQAHEAVHGEDDVQEAVREQNLEEAEQVKQEQDRN